MIPVVGIIAFAIALLLIVSDIRKRKISKSGKDAFNHSDQNNLIFTGKAYGLILCLVVILGAVIYYSGSSQKFNSIAWKQATERYEEISKTDPVGAYRELELHKPMARALVREKTLIGLSKEQVQELLGLEGEGFKSNRWTYWLDFTTTDNKRLEVNFTDNVVTRVRIYEVEYSEKTPVPSGFFL